MLNVEVFCPKMLFLIPQIPHHKSRGISIPHKNCGIADPAGLVSTVMETKIAWMGQMKETVQL